MDAAAGLLSVHSVTITPQSPGAIGRTERLGCGAMPDDNADLRSPSGSASPGAEMGGRRVVERLDEPACMELLGAGRIARLIYNSRYGPVALPSEYKIHEGSIVSAATRSPSPSRTCALGSRTPSTRSSSRLTTSTRTRARDGWC